MNRRTRLALIPLLLTLAACQKGQVELYHAASEREAVRILDALYSAGVDSGRKVTPKDVRKGAWRVLVAEDDLSRATNLINTAPGVLGRSDTNLVEVVSGSGWAKSPAQVQSVLDLARAEQLARQIETFPHVLQAAVTLDRASDARTVGTASQARPSASAVVLMEEGWGEGCEADIKKTLRFGVSQLDDEHLSVIVTCAAPRGAAPRVERELVEPAAIAPTERWITIVLGLSTLALALRWWSSTRRDQARVEEGAAPASIAPPTAAGVARPSV